MNTVSISRRKSTVKTFPTSSFRHRVKKTLHIFGLRDCELSILITDDEEIRSLNKVYRHKDYATDVLSFPQHLDATPRTPIETFHRSSIGDIVLSADAVKRQAEQGCLTRLHPARPNEEYDWTPLDEASFLTMHGILHLLGYDHETDDDAAVMEDVELAALKQLLVRSR